VTVFWLAASALTLTALAFLLVPLWQSRRRDGGWSAAGLGAALALAPGAAALYLQITTWDGQPVESAQAAPSAPPAVEEMVEGLRARLAADPEDVTGWRLLGQSYLTMGRYTDARQAFREAWGRTPEPDNELKLGLGEAEALTDRQALQGAAGELFEEVLASEPENPKALWYGGLAALETQRPELARERWSRLLDQGPPDAVAQILRQQLDALGAPAGAAAPAAVAQAAETDDSGLVLQLRVGLGEGLTAAGLGPQAALFIFARTPQGGPPLAVIRQPASAIPGEFTLSDANAMTPGRSLADFDLLDIVARVSASGQPTAQPGDLFGELEFRPQQDERAVDLLIDQVVP
jgi:cytochrome c-type biogenesis protein CcmH